MYIQANVTECDYTDTKYDAPVPGAHVLCRGATGRVCVVMFVGPEWLADNAVVLSSREEAIAWAESEGWADF